MFTFTAEVFPAVRGVGDVRIDRDRKTVVVVHATSYEKAIEKIGDLLPAPPSFSEWHISVIEIEEILNSVFVS